jgi:lipopolysaccharide/colanic/teichoic acid biosynthesis glycosyltransferase
MSKTRQKTWSSTLNNVRQYNPKNIAGYHTFYELLNRGVNLMLSLFFMVLLSPVMAVLIPVVILVNGWPFIYAGTRLGKNKKQFIMFKFRTLPVDFEQQYDAQLVSYSHGYRLPWFCRFMRDTRLDEIPQLFNILRGDMDFVGPRPVRPSVYNAFCRSIKGYDKRFSVKPGLIGYSQLFTPHSTPKRIRSFIDNRATRFKKNIVCDTLMILLAGFGVIVKTVHLLGRISLMLIMEKVLRQYTNKRGLDRIKQKEGLVEFCAETGQFDYFCMDFEPDRGVLKDINEEYIRVDTRVPLKKNRVMFRAVAMVKTKLCQTHRKSFFSYGTVFKVYENDDPHYKFAYILRYEPVSDLNRYFVDQYFLKKSLMRYVL